MTITMNEPSIILTAEAEVIVQAQEVTNDFTTASNQTSIPTATLITSNATTIHHSNKTNRKYQRRQNCKCQKAQVLERTPGGKVGFVLLSVPLSMVGAVRPKTTERLVTNHVKRDIHQVYTCSV